MAHRQDSKRKRKKSNNTANNESKMTYAPRRDWSKITFYVFSLSIVLSMVCALFIHIIPV